MARKKLSSRIFGVLSWLIVCSPIWVYLIELPSFGRLQHNDYYAIVADLADGDHLTRDPLRWLSLHANEHRATVPVLFYGLNIALTNGHNLGLTVFSLLLLTIELTLLVSLLPADIRSSVGARSLCGLGIALFCYTPVAAHNVAMGFSGTIWFFGNVLAAAAIATLNRRAGIANPWALWPVLVFGILAAFSHTTHLVLWPVLVAGAVFLRLDRGRLVLLAMGAALVFALFWLTYKPLPYHPEVETRNLQGLLRYAAVYVGTLFSPDLDTARTLGMIGIAAGILALGLITYLSRASRPLRSDIAPWLMVMFYGLGNALLTAVGRSGFGEGQAMSSRYASLAALFWIGLLASLGVLAWRFRPATPIGRVAVALLLAGLVTGLGTAMHRRGEPLIERFAARGARQEVAAMAIIHGIHDDDIIERTVAPWPVHIWALRDFLKKTGHVPFDREQRSRLGERLEADRLSDRPHAEVRGYFDQLTKLSDGLVRLGGWVFSSELEVVDVMVLDGGGSVRGEVVTGIHRPDLVKAVHEAALTAGWEGYATIGQESREIRAYVRIAGDPLLYPLPMIPEIDRQLRPAD